MAETGPAPLPRPSAAPREHPQQQGSARNLSTNGQKELAPAPVLTAPTAVTKPSKTAGTLRALWPLVKVLGVLALAGAAYWSYVVYTRRQPYEWSGRVEARTVSLGSRVGGRVKSVGVREGDDVKAGQVIVELEPGDLEAQQAQAEAQIAAAQAELEKLVKGSRQEEIAQAAARLAEARAAVETATTRHDQLEKQLQRVKALSGLTVTASEYDVQVAAAKAAGGQLSEASARETSAEAALRLLRNGAREEDVRARQAALAAARARLEILNWQVHELSIRAPSDARVETITVRRGDILRVDAPAASVLEAGQLYVLIYVPEPLIGRIAVGNDVPINVDSFSGRTFPGRVEHINRVGEFTPRSLQTVEERSDEVFAARVAILDGEKDLRAGMAAFIRIPKK